MSKAEHPPGGLPPQEETDEVTVLHGGPEPPGTPRPGASLPLPGQLLAGRYAVLSTLGQGGMGVVLAASDSRLDRRVALKLLSPSRAVGGSSSPLQARLQREAQAMARLNHPHVIGGGGRAGAGDRLWRGPGGPGPHGGAAQTTSTP